MYGGLHQLPSPILQATTPKGRRGGGLVAAPKRGRGAGADLHSLSLMGA